LVFKRILTKIFDSKEKEELVLFVSEAVFQICSHHFLLGVGGGLTAGANY